MATVNVQKLLVQLNQEIQFASTPSDAFILSRAVSTLKTGAVISVPSFSKLPNAGDNLGSLYLVEADKLLYYGFKDDYTGNVSWVPITQINLSTLWSWGCNNVGQLGNGTIFNSTTPVSTSGCGSNWKLLCAGGYTSAGIKEDGTLWTWGCNGIGQLGDGTTVNRSSPGTVAGGGTTWCELSIGYFSSAAVKTDGTLWTWGCNGQGILGDGTTVNKCSPGTVAGGGTTWTNVDLGRCHSLSVKTDGTLWTWGFNNCGQLGEGTTVSRCSPGTVSVISSWVVSASGGKYHSTAISENATTVRSLTSYESTNNIPQKLYNTWTWGANNCGQLGDNSFTTKCSPSTVNTNSTICKFKAAGYNTFRAQTSLYIAAAGDNSFGQLGNCTNKACSSFVTPCTTLANRSNEITSDTLRPNFCNITSNGKTAMSVTVDGKLWTWGYNANGILANQTTSNRCYPGLTCIGGNTWNQVSLGLCHVIANTSETL